MTTLKPLATEATRNTLKRGFDPYTKNKGVMKHRSRGIYRAYRISEEERRFLEIAQKDFL